MKRIKYISFFTLQFLLWAVCFAQNELLTFNRIPPPSGFHSGSKAGVQDPQGYMWIGTYQGPLRRYDGYNYVSYGNDPLNSNSLAANWVEALCAARNGIIWIGTWGYGLDRLDPATGNFKHFRYNAKDSNSLSNDFVRTILEDREGVLWIGTTRGLNRYDPKTGKFQHYFHKRDDPYSLSFNQVVKIYEDRQGTIWVGTGSVWKDEGGETDEGGLNRFDKKTGKFIRHLHEPANPHSLINNKVKAIFEDSRGTFWIGTAGDGLHTLDREKGIFERHQYDPAHPEKLSRAPQKKIRPYADDHITFIIEDSARAIWIGTFGNGVNRYDPKTNKVTHYPLFKDPVSGVQLEVAWWACTSRDGMLWISYWRGLYRIDPLQKNIPYFTTGRPVTGIYEDKFGVLWYGTDEGLVRKDRSTGTEQRYVHDPHNPHSISNNRIDFVFEDRNSELWIGTSRGLNRFDRKTGTISRYKSDTGFDSIFINESAPSIYEDQKGTLWFGTGAGLIRMNRQAHTFTFTHYRHIPGDTNSLSHNEAYRIYGDNHENLWIGTRTDGLNRFIRQTGKFQRFLNGINIHSISQDSEGVLWVGTSLGLYRSNAALNGFSRFTGPNGEFAGNLIVNGVLEDNQMNLWVNASVGICKMNPLRNEVVIYGRYDDPINHNGTGSFKGKNGELFFGGGSGYFTFFPEQLTGNKKPPDIVINEFRLADNPEVPGKQSVLKQPLSQIKKIRLSHKQNVFSFDFAGIHYSSPGKNQHLFILEGLDNAWRKAGEEKTAYYYNVPPGHYTFRIRAANSDGVWTEKSIAVIISPPWWKTWWAYSIYGLLFLAAVYALHRIQKKRVIEKERKKTRDRELAQAKEIEKAYTELKSTQAQLIQSEKMASLGELTAGIAHEIQNPLNFVNNFSDLSTELVDEMNEEIDKGNTEDAKLIAQDLIKNLKKINHHGKRAGDIVKGMLQHSRSSSGVKEPTDINKLADEYLRLAYHGLRAKDKSFNATMKTDYDETIGKINIIPQDIGRVMLNLYNNAFYAAPLPPEGGFKDPDYKHVSTVSVSTKKLGDKVLISVKDNGPGIPQKLLDKIFQPFFTTKPAGQGTGLGLSLSYDIVKAHGGELKVETKEGQGSEFVISIPV